MYTKFTTDFPIVTIEDPFDQDDWDNTAAFTAEGVCQVLQPAPGKQRRRGLDTRLAADRPLVPIRLKMATATPGRSRSHLRHHPHSGLRAWTLGSTPDA